MKTKLLLQIGVVFGVCLLGELLTQMLPFVFPASVMGMLLLFLLLLFGVVKEKNVGDFADFLLKNMAFFFIPSGVALIDQMDVVKGKIVPLLAVLFITTVLTFAAAAFAVRLTVALQNRIKREGK